MQCLELQTPGVLSRACGRGEGAASHGSQCSGTSHKCYDVKWKRLHFTTWEQCGTPGGLLAEAVPCVQKLARGGRHQRTSSGTFLANFATLAGGVVGVVSLRANGRDGGG